MAIRATAQETIIDITDAYSVYLTCASYTFPGTTTAAKPGSAKTQVMAMRGADQVTASVDTAKIVSPSGVTATSDADPTAPTITINVTSAVTAPGKVKIPVIVDGQAEFVLEFAFGIALTGNTGAPGTSVTIKSTSVTYQVSTNGTTAPSGEWLASIPSVPQGQYLWTRTVVTYSDGKSTTAYSVSRNATNGSNGTSVTITGQSVTYQASNQGTTPPAGAWAAEIPSVPAGQYLWTKTVVNYSDGKSTTSYSVSRQGTNGTNGQDAINMVITSSNGTIFKNSAIDTTLTAHVYKGGVELQSSQIAALGTIKWYKDGASLAAATGLTFNIKASSVNMKTNIVAQLEG